MAKPGLTELQREEIQPLPTYRSIFLAADASDHSDRGAADVAILGTEWGSTVTGAHVYAAKLHDKRFRQMEGGLPEQFKEERELEKQREIHDDLITKGLSLITDSYLDQVEQVCLHKEIDYKRCSLEGKNYRELVRETNSGKYDLLVMGSLGLGAVPGSCIGTVCERVVRRSDIDTLVIKDPKRSITQGPIMVAVDGSTRSYGGLLTALSMAQSWQLPVHVVSAFDPYFHYVAFNRIAGILSEEAGKVFRFKEQEKLHEEIIDGGLAKIYQGHLDVAESIAQDYGIEIETRLLDGKPFEVIEKQVRKINPSLLVLGKVGIHADDELDIGGNAENLLRNVGCAVLLSQREYRPRVDIVAEATTSWTRQAEERLNNVPSFARGMARIGVLRYVQEMGHTVVTAKVVDAATQSLCPVRHDEFNAAERAAENTVCPQSSTAKTEAKLKLDWSLEAEPDSEQQTLDWTDEAERRLGRVPSGFIRDMTRQRIEAFARKHGATKVTAELMGEKYQEWGEGSRKQGMKMSWSEEAQAKIDRIPDFIRGMAIKEIERCATELGFKEITPEVISKASDTWAGSGKFHSDDKPSQ